MRGARADRQMFLLIKYANLWAETKNMKRDKARIRSSEKRQIALQFIAEKVATTILGKCRFCPSYAVTITE